MVIDHNTSSKKDNNKDLSRKPQSLIGLKHQLIWNKVYKET